MDVLDLLFRRLAERVSREPGAGAPGELTIAHVYQQLVPYRMVRGDLGLGELAEYEHALLRLLSGEREYLTLESAQAQEEIRRELQAPNPILGLYRDYAAVGVHLNPVRIPAFAPPRPEPAPPPGVRLAPLEDEVMAEAGAPAPRSPPEPRPEPAPRAGCRGCRAALPEGRAVRFCPFCGVTQGPLPCRGCGEPVEPEWSFCVECGLPREASPPV
jgi:hypothetical protein